MLYFLVLLCHNIVWFEIFSKEQEIFRLYSVLPLQSDTSFSRNPVKLSYVYFTYIFLYYPGVDKRKSLFFY